jgi:hypothetical protein
MVAAKGRGPYSPRRLAAQIERLSFSVRGPTFLQHRHLLDGHNPEPTECQDHCSDSPGRLLPPPNTGAGPTKFGQQVPKADILQKNYRC